MKQLKRFLLFAVVVVTFTGVAYSACAVGWANGYGFCRTITIDRTKVPNTNQTNFPVLVSLTNADFKTTANSGLINHTVLCCSGTAVTAPADMVFSAVNNGASLLNWEFESYDATTGEILAWVNVPTVTTATDTEFYVFYGKASVITYQSTYTSTWNSNYNGVWHMGTAAVLHTQDATANVNNATPSGGPASVTGKISGAVGVASGLYLTVSSSTTMNIAGNISYEAWFYPVSNGTTSALVSHYDDYAMAMPAGGIFGDSRDAYVWLGTSFNVMRNTNSYTLNAWNHLAVTADGTNIKTYLNGVLGATTASANQPTGQVRTTYLGFDGGSLALVGSLDEIRVAATALSGDWIITGYNNMNSPGTFLALGGQVAPALSLIPRKTVNIL